MTEKAMGFYHASFKDNIRSEAEVRRLLSLPENIYFELPGGMAVMNGDTVLMLCVLPEDRRKGVGSRLLKLCEERAKEMGRSELKFCDGPGYIMPGIPMDGETEKFFSRRGYEHSWGDTECVDMDISLPDAPEFSPPESGFTFRRALPGEMERVAACVERAEENFAKYYRRPALYEEGAVEYVLAAFDGGAPCGAVLAGGLDGLPEVGTVGCTATPPEYRRRGIATALIKLGTARLKAAGFKRGFIGYTYTDIVPLYAKAGYAVCGKYFMGVKKLK